MTDDHKPCDCCACAQRRKGHISAVTGRVPRTRQIVEHDERDQRVVAASMRLRQEEGD